MLCCWWMYGEEESMWTFPLDYFYSVESRFEPQLQPGEKPLPTAKTYLNVQTWTLNWKKQCGKLQPLDISLDNDVLLKHMRDYEFTKLPLYLFII